MEKSAANILTPEPLQSASPDAYVPVERTFKTLVTSVRPNCAAVIAFAVLNSTGDTRRMAVSAALDRGERPGLDAVIRVFHDIPEDLQKTSVERSDSFLSILRTAIKDPDRVVRSNVCDFLVRMADQRVAYLLADLLQDPLEQIKRAAQEGLLSLAHGYHTFAAEVERGKTNVPRQTLETKRYALLDALLTGLRFYKSHERPEIIAALLSLDPRGDEVLIDILANPMDRRRKIVLDILETAVYSRAIAFLLTMLKSAKTASLAVEILETRFDLDFLKALLSNSTLLANTRVTAALGQIQFVPWLRPGSERASLLPERLAVRAVRFLLFTGAAAAEKTAALETLSASKNIALASAARFVISAEARHIHSDKIDAGLVKIEEHCPDLAPETPEPEPSQLVVQKAPARSYPASFLSDEALFHNFVNSFDTIGKAERTAALDEFRSKGVLLREVKKALGASDADVVLRTMKVVEFAECHDDLTTELILLTKHPEGRVRSAAVRQLGKAGAYDALKTLFDALSDRDRRVLANAVEALESTGNKQLLRLLDPLMKHPDNRVRANAAKAAWTLGAADGRDCLVDMLKNQKAAMRLSALWGLRQIGATDQIDLIRSVAKSDSDERVRKSAELTVAELENVL